LLGRQDEARRLVAVADAFSTRDDTYLEVERRRAHSLLAAADEDTARALSYAREAVAIALVGDCLNLQGSAYETFAHISPDDAVSAWRSAIEVYEAKGNVTAAQRVSSTAASPG
jgi:hypothetical protein